MGGIGVGSFEDLVFFQALIDSHLGDVLAQMIFGI